MYHIILQSRVQYQSLAFSAYRDVFLPSSLASPGIYWHCECFICTTITCASGCQHQRASNTMWSIGVQQVLKCMPPLTYWHVREIYGTLSVCWLHNSLAASSILVVGVATQPVNTQCSAQNHLIQNVTSLHSSLSFSPNWRVVETCEQEWRAVAAIATTALETRVRFLFVLYSMPTLGLLEKPT